MQQILSTLIPIIEFLVMLSVLVVIHELGHFVTARIFKVKIEEFGLGYPPMVRKLFSWKGIPFTLNLIPVGGFVRMEGESGGEVTTQNTDSKFGPFYSKPKWQRLIIILAGATVNFLFGVVAFTVIYSKLGIPVTDTPIRTMVVAVDEGPGKSAGMKEGDRIIFANDENGSGISVDDSNIFTTWVRSRPDTNLRVVILRDGKDVVVTLHTRKQADIANLGAIGVVLDTPMKLTFYPWYRMPFEATKFGLERSFLLTKLILQSLGQMGSDLVSKGKVPTDVAGPVGIVHEVVKQKVFVDLLGALNFTAMFSINLAIMNVLPIPALDGGRALFILLEYIVGRRRIAKIEDHANSIGIAILLMIIVLISIKDVWMLFH